MRGLFVVVAAIAVAGVVVIVIAVLAVVVFVHDCLYIIHRDPVPHHIATLQRMLSYEWIRRTVRGVNRSKEVKPFQ